MTGKLDEKRSRYSFQCHFRDLLKDTEGKISALIVFENVHNECYFESLTITLSKPRHETFRIVDADISVEENDLNKVKMHNRPTRDANEAQPKEKPRSKYT